ncbi:MAG: hypothetical protein ACO3DK_08455, partial [Bacteroidia bacterium]
MRFSKVLFMGLTMLWACRGEDTVSERPELAWVSSEIVSATPERDSLVLLQFRYADGNGDLGLEPRDSLYPFAFFCRARSCPLV